MVIILTTVGKIIRNRIKKIFMKIKNNNEELVNDSNQPHSNELNKVNNQINNK